MTSYIVRSSSGDGSYGSFSTQDAAERALSMVTRKMDPNAYIVASLDWQDRALAAEAEVERLTAALAERDRRIAEALNLMGDRANSSPGYPLLERVLRGESDE